MAAILIMEFAGANSTSAVQSISLPGAKALDTVVFIADVVNGMATTSLPFETAISVDDQIQQMQNGGSGNQSGHTFRVMLVRS